MMEFFGYILAFVIYALGANALYDELKREDWDFDLLSSTLVLAWPLVELANLFGLLDD